MTTSMTTASRMQDAAVLPFETGSEVWFHLGVPPCHVRSAKTMTMFDDGAALSGSTQLRFAGGPSFGQKRTLVTGPSQAFGSLMALALVLA